MHWWLVSRPQLQSLSPKCGSLQLYNGELKIWGCKKLLWHRMAIDEKKLQILPPERRHFPFAPSSNFNVKNAVNMSAFCKPSGDTTEKQKHECANFLLKQLETDGFAYVRGTGLQKELCQEALQATKAFLTDADESVRRSCLTKDRARRGYSPMCTENFASLIGAQGPNDLVRKFRLGPVAQSLEVQTQSSLLQPNIWPQAEIWDEGSANNFQKTIEDYYKGVCHAANALVSAICDAILRKQPELHQTMEVLSLEDSLSHTSILTLLGYTVGTRHRGKNKSPLVAAHTDVGVVTMLLFDGPGCAQLQRSDHAGGWVDVGLPSSVQDDPIFVLNIGDCLSELTCKMLPSTLHRVVADKKNAEPRHCLALFVGLGAEARVLVNKETLSYEEWRKRRIARAQNVLKASSGNNSTQLH
jgi:isopenicillin N synthase-like dioxygenase